MTSYGGWERQRMLMVAMFGGLLSPICSSSYIPSMEQVTKDLATSDSMTDLTITSYLIMMGLAPVVWGSLGDTYGRRNLLILAGSINIVGSLLCGLVTNVEQLIGLRVLQAVGTSAANVLGFGIISDIYPREERGTAIGLYAMGPLMGQLVGPIFGGFVTQFASWRAIFYCLAGMGLISVLSILLFLPETLVDKKPTVTIPNPFGSLKFLLYAKVILPTIYSIVLFVTFYYIIIAQNNTFKSYSLNKMQLGLTYLPLGIADVIGSLAGGRLSDLCLNQIKKRYPKCPSEARLILLPAGISLITSGLFALSFLLSMPETHIAMILATLMATCTILSIIFVILQTYIMDLFPKNAASTSAAGNLLRILAVSVLASQNSAISRSFSLDRIFFTFAISQTSGFAIMLILLIFRKRFLMNDSPSE